MEFEGFQRSMQFLQSEGFHVGTFFSYRHVSIAKHLREKKPQTKHYFDLWHLQKNYGFGFITGFQILN